KCSFRGIAVYFTKGLLNAQEEFAQSLLTHRGHYVLCGFSILTGGKRNYRRHRYRFRRRIYRERESYTYRNEHPNRSHRHHERKRRLWLSRPPAWNLFG